MVCLVVWRFVIGGTEILLNIGGGVALLLWGIRMVRTGVTRAFGAALRRTLATGTKSRMRAFGLGLGVTVLLQSSTATALIIASFAGRGLIAASAALAIMLGADLGTTLVAQLLSFNLTLLSPILILIGLVAFKSGDSGRPRHLGRVAIGLGLMLLALKLVVATSAPLRDSDLLSALVVPLASEPILAVLFAAILTWLAHSSLAVILLIMSLASVGVIPVGLSLALVVGANMGGALPAVFMTMGGGSLARRVPVGNLIMRVAGGIAVLPLLGLIAPLLASIDGDVARQVVNFHTAFNLALAIVFLPLVPFVDALCLKLLPTTIKKEDPAKPRYLDQNALDTPTAALAGAARETLRMGDLVERMLTDTIEVFRRDDEKLARQVEANDDAVDQLHESIKLYLTKVSSEALDEKESRQYVEVLTFTTNLEHIGDIIDKNLMELAIKKIRKRLSFSDAGWKEITSMHDQVMQNLQLAFNVFLTRDVKLARQLLQGKVALRDAEWSAAEHHFDRLRARRPETVETSGLHLDLIRDLKRINSHLTSVAYPILEEAGELRTSRLRQTTTDAPKGAASLKNLPEG
ncbi:MAG: Na/Pi cotransporter family protein [Alphaproteobacteria bacterium]